MSAVRAEAVSDQLAALCHDRLRIAPSRVRLLPGELHRTFAVDTDDGARFVVKLVPDDAGARHFLTWQLELLDAARHGVGVEVPHPCRDASGQALFEVAHTHLGPALALVTTWVEGTVAADCAPVSDRVSRQWGGLAARMTQALSAVPTPPGVRRTHPWDVTRGPQAVAAHRAAARRVVAAADDALVDQVLDRFAVAVTPVLAGLPRAVTHQDLNDHNVLLADGQGGSDDEAMVAGVIDFSDALETVRLAELAVAGAYAMLRQDDPVRTLAQVVRGYEDVVPLTVAERGAVFPLALMRLVQNAVIWAARGAEEQQTSAEVDGTDTASGDYGARRSRHTWRTLRRLASLDPAAVAAALDPVGRSR